ncbi:D-alanine--D-alanine ligase [Pelistega sp. MC2]|uniref:D-alanine--D-alanine ligase n=1 Tax=Pelistega sp. MC2 TaxID=1720297 RepID=UPI0008DB2971|nr:D-alanine--D-alanine ligase [Pelistega sp. MC2]
MKNLGKVGVLYGGISAERSVSLQSGQGVYEALKSKGVDAHLFDTGERSLADLAEQKFDRVFIALHGRFGEDGCTQGVLELLGIPYTGPGVMASSIAMDKIMTKRILLEKNLPTPRYYVARSEEDLHMAEEQLGLPMIVKPPHEGSTLGLKKVNVSQEISEAFELSKTYESELLAEQCIIGRELTVPVMGKGSDAYALPIIEIIAPDGNYDFNNKYIANDTVYECPAKLSPELTAKIQEYCVQAYNAIGAEGWSRIDVMLDKNNQPWILEINTSPGMTSHSLVPMSAKANGMSYADLCVYLVETASTKVFKK